MTLLLVVAHPDDETFGCGSLLLHAHAAGVRTVVVCATRGERGEVREGVPLPPGGVAALREAELRTAAGLLGVDEVEILDLRDSGMAGEPPAGSVCGVPARDLVDRVAEAVVRHRPDVVVTLAGDDGHRDHLALAGAARTALEGTGVRLYLQCLPSSLMREWVRASAHLDHARPYVRVPDLGTADGDVTTVLDTSASYRQRLAALAAHRSQRSPFEDLPEDLRHRFLTREHLVRVVPPWNGGEVEREIPWVPDGPRPRVGAARVGEARS